MLLFASRRFDEVDGVGSDSGARDAKEQEEVGAACNGIKYLAAEAGYNACERAIMTHGVRTVSCLSKTRLITVYRAWAIAKSTRLSGTSETPSCRDWRRCRGPLLSFHVLTYS